MKFHLEKVNVRIEISVDELGQVVCFFLGLQRETTVHTAAMADSVAQTAGQRESNDADKDSENEWDHGMTVLDAWIFLKVE